ncbi:tetraacyldisaccharide 4'-kinase [Rhabdochlamydiaceae symbiont of Dictyostelium giganteum]|uniref:tetraacyldisaccharide 4'-kinase n=1 Tax=Rhabdochlamydiaceae symbiont of Dictyostelium giganteum TaxID=3342349 RepID=UPI00384AA858
MISIAHFKVNDSMDLEAYMQKVISQKSVMRFFFWVLSLLYKAIIWVKNQAYRFHLFPIKKVSAVVISIGNVTAGGTGKTPLTSYLARELSQNYTVAILSRGYGSSAGRSKKPLRVVSSMSAQEVGDEPLLLARQHPAVAVWVGKDRYQSALRAIHEGAEILLLDDGFQHQRLHRDFNVVVVSSHRPFDNEHFLPRGYLRDFPSRLKEATLIAVMGKPLLPFLEAPSVVFKRTSPLSLEGKKVGVFCAIANPKRFVQQVKLVHGTVCAAFFKPDHAAFSFRELAAFFQQHSPDLLVCTEKDHVKLSLEHASLPICALPLILHIQEGRARWEQFIHQIQLQVHHVRRISCRSP